MPLADLAPALQIIVRRHGEPVLADRARMHGLLRDYAPTASGEIATLMRAHDAGCVERLGAGPLDPGAIAAECRALAETIGPGGQDAAETWAGAMAYARSGAAAPDATSSLQPLPLPGASSPPAGRRRWFGLLG